MSSRTRHPRQPSDTSQNQYKVWKPQERQVESDSERPRRTTTTNQAQRGQRDANYRGYQSDSPVTASTSQYRSGTSTSKTPHHASRSSNTNGHSSRPQQPISNSTTPAQQNYHPSGGQSQRSQAEAYDPRLASYKRSTSTTPMLQPYERVPSSDEFAKASRTNFYSRSGAPIPQPGPEAPSQDASSSSRKVRDRENDKERERGREKEKEKVVREKLKEYSDRYLEREVERRTDARDVSRDAYRERDKARERERRLEKEKEVASHRDRSTSKAPTPRDAQDSRTRESGAPAPSHRRNRYEEVPPSSEIVCYTSIGVVDCAPHKLVTDSADSY